MGTDALPVVAQIKSILQLLFGQNTQALETQINFIEATPVLSQLKALYDVLVRHDLVQAMDSQRRFLIITNATIDNIPLVGHLKGLGHYIIGDFGNGHNAMKRSSRTTAVILSACFACTVVWPSTALNATIHASCIGSMIGGFAMDSLLTLLENVIHKNGRLYGIYFDFAQMVQHPWDIGKMFDFVMGPIMDAFLGAFVGYRVHQHQMLNAPTSHAQAVTLRSTTATIKTLPPPPTVHVPPSFSHVLRAHIPLPAPFNPWNKRVLAYSAAVGRVGAHARDDFCGVHISRRIGQQQMPNLDWNSINHEVLLELNKVRQNPQSLVSHLQDLISNMRGDVYYPPNEPGVGIEYTEGVAVVHEAVAFLKKQPQREPLNMQPELSEAAMMHVKEQRVTGDIGHDSRNGMGPPDRMQNVHANKSWKGGCGENISYGMKTGKDIVSALIVDDGVLDRGHRVNIFKQEWKIVGIATGSHPIYGTISVMDFAVGYS